jgi:hypothetical protein
MTSNGRVMAAYGYANENPLYYVDRDGNYGTCDPQTASCLPHELPFKQCFAACMRESGGAVIGMATTSTALAASISQIKIEVQGTLNGNDFYGYPQIGPWLAGLLFGSQGEAAATLAIAVAVPAAVGGCVATGGLSVACAASCAPRH